MTKFNQTYRDKVIIPDKYNTGCDMSKLQPYSESIDPFLLAGGAYRGDKIYTDSTYKVYGIDFNGSTAFKNLTTNEIVYEDIDFTNVFASVRPMNLDSDKALETATKGFEYPLKLTFKNCLIPCFFTHQSRDGIESKIVINVENCTMYRQSGYGIFKDCKFGDATWWQSSRSEVFNELCSSSMSGDTMNPYWDSKFYNCYCSDAMYKTTTQGSAHIDGWQTQAYDDIVVENCRWEVPAMNYEFSQGGYNAAVYLQGVLDNSTFKDVIVNGATKTIQTAQHTNTSFNNWRYGKAAQYNSMSVIESASDLEWDYGAIDNIYVSSVINDGDIIKIVVTNDTDADRTISIKTNKGTTENNVPRVLSKFTTPALALNDDFSKTNVDYEIEIDSADVEYLVCYDITDEENPVQIRFVDFTSNKRYTEVPQFSQTFRDKVVIPDKYNTGVNNILMSEDEKSELTVYSATDSVTFKSLTEGVSDRTVTPDSDGLLKISFWGGQSNCEYLIENADLLCYLRIKAVNQNQVSNVKFVFKNCKLPAVGIGDGTGNILTEIYNCEFHGGIPSVYVKGQNISVTDCKGGDGCNPTAYVDIENIYFYDLLKSHDDGHHIDAIQAYGADGYKCEEVHFNNFRNNMFTPLGEHTGTGYVNSPLMVTSEKSPDTSGYTNTSFTNGIIGGGNYHYITHNGHTHNNLLFKDIIYTADDKGCDEGVYPTYEDHPEANDYTLDNCVMDKSVFVSSVYKSNDKLYVTYSNQSFTEQTLKVKTNKWEKEIQVPCIPSDFASNNSIMWDDLPFDLQLEENDNDIEYVACYLGEKQIRFVDFTDDKKYTEQYLIKKATLKAIADAIRYMEGNMYSPSILVSNIAKRIKNLVVQIIDNNVKFSKGFRDLTVIPDKYNTGLTDESALTKVEDTNGVITSTDGKSITLIDKNTYWGISGYAPAHLSTLVGEVVFENYDFVGTKNYTFGIVDATKFTSGQATLIFKNCKFNDIYGSEKLKMIFDNCSFTSGAGKLNCEFNNCFIGDSCPGDASQPIKDVVFNDCYFAYLKNELSTTGSHVDGIQTLGISGTDMSGLEVNNCRFTLPDLLYGGHNTSYINAAFFLCPEKSNLTEFKMNNVIIDIASQYPPVRLGTTSGITNSGVVLNNVKCSNKYTKLVNQGEEYIEEQTDCGLMNELYVSSIIKSADKIKVITTNNTNADKTLKIKTNKGETTYTIEKSPTQTELLDESGAYLNLTCEEYEGLYANKVIEIPSTDVEYIVCYDGDTQIRFVDFTDDARYTETSGGGTRTLTVGVGDTYDYNDIASAYADANSGDTIEIHEGTYYAQKIGYGKDVNFVGTDKENCILYCDKADKVNGDVFLLTGGSIKNLTIKETHENPITTDVTNASSYKAYCIHIDNELARGKTIFIENCIMENKYCACIGIGCQQDLNIIVKDCDMYKYDLNPNTNMKDNGAFYAHINSEDNTTGQFISVQNCNIKSKYGKAFVIDWTNTNGREMAVECIGNTITSEELGTTDVASTQIRLAETSSGNNIPGLNYVSPSSSITPTTMVGTIATSGISTSNSRTIYIFPIEENTNYLLSTSARNNTFIGYSDTDTKANGDTLDGIESLGYTQLSNKEITSPSGANYLFVSVYANDYTAILVKAE